MINLSLGVGLCAPHSPKLIAPQYVTDTEKNTYFFGFGFGPRLRLFSLSRGFPLLAGELIESQTLSDDPRYCDAEALGIGELPIVIPISLLVQVAEQVERFDRNISSVDPTFQQ